jgi:hypothetical protein
MEISPHHGGACAICHGGAHASTHATSVEATRSRIPYMDSNQLIESNSGMNKEYSHRTMYVVGSFFKNSIIPLIVAIAIDLNCFDDHCEIVPLPISNHNVDIVQT